MDKLRALATLVRIVDAGSLTAAAEALDTSLPTVVRQLAELERALGARLLQRTTRRMALTDEGRDYYERSKRILAEVADADAAVSDTRAALQGPLRITAPVLFGKLHVAPLAAAFARAHPGVTIDFLLVDRVVNLVDEGLDLGVRIGALPDSSLVANPAGFVRRVVCASPKYLAQHGTPHAPADLAHHACLRFSGIGSIHDWTFVDDRRSRGVAVAGPLSGNQAEPLIEACADGLGIGMFLSYQVAALTAKRRLVEVLAAFAPPPLPVNVVYPQARLLPARTRAFAADLRAGLTRRIA